MDDIEQDLLGLSSKPSGTHLGELELSWMKDILPEQFLMQYDYDFLYYMRNVLLKYWKLASAGEEFIAHTVIDELVLYLIVEVSRLLMSGIEPHIPNGAKDELPFGYCDDWNDGPFDIFGDMDIVTTLYNDRYLDRDNIYHFDHWYEDQFCCEE